VFEGTGVIGVALSVLLASALAGPSKGSKGSKSKGAKPAEKSAKSGDGAKITKEQLEYSKQMFAEGEAAMAKGDYQTAYTKFAEGYRYAPHLHAFTYNIAASAEALGDCKIAKRYYQMFVDLVPEHPERKKVQKKLEGYQKTCIEDAESSEVASAEVPKADKADRLKAEADRAMNEALFQLRVAYAAYANGKTRFKGKTKAFGAPSRHKKRHVKKMAKLLGDYGIKVEEREVPEPELPLELEAACRIAKVQENRTLRALELAMEKFDAADAYRIMDRFVIVGERDLEKFEGCS
jgi:hypothetical protein